MIAMQQIILYMSNNFFLCCVDRNIALNIEQCKFFQTTIMFTGFQLSAERYQIDQTITEAISSYPTPTSRTNLHSFIGLVNQLTASMNSMATLFAPLRPLLSTKNDFQWLSDHKEAFSGSICIQPAF